MLIVDRKQKRQKWSSEDQWANDNVSLHKRMRGAIRKIEWWQTTARPPRGQFRYQARARKVPSSTGLDLFKNDEIVLTGQIYHSYRLKNCSWFIRLTSEGEESGKPILIYLSDFDMYNL